MHSIGKKTAIVLFRCGLIFAMIGLLPACSESHVIGQLQQWHPITLWFEGPILSETGTPNPFLDYRLDVTFSIENKSYTVPGYFAADGEAAETGASGGSTWLVHFLPDEPGRWHYVASFRSGPDISVNEDHDAGEPLAFDGQSGTFEIEPSDKKGRDFRSTGRLEYVGERYLRFAGSGTYFLKGGADSPENLLAYQDFDNTQPGNSVFRTGEAQAQGLHDYDPHAQDWHEGDPTWRNGKGKNLIGALNYLASKGMNSVYFLTMNIDGDGDDVFMWTRKDQRLRFDCSKLDQWDIVFSHMDSLGLMLHIVTQETENDQLLDDGDLGQTRKLYYRELVARFSYHPAIVWNLGEENTNTDQQRQDFASYIRSLDPYHHPIVVHTYPGHYEEVYTPLLGFLDLEGPSLQMGDMSQTHAETNKWISQSVQAGHPWFVSLDEIGPADTGVMPDGRDSNQDQVRKQALWGNLMAGGAGVEWYFGYQYPHNDLNMEDWRSRDRMWDYTRYALDFFHMYLPFWEMYEADDLTSATDDYVLAKENQIYALYLPHGGQTDLDLRKAPYSFSLTWYNPRSGDFDGVSQQITGGEIVSLGPPPQDADLDWAILITRDGEG